MGRVLLVSLGLICCLFGSESAAQSVPAARLRPATGSSQPPATSTPAVSSPPASAVPPSMTPPRDGKPVAAGDSEKVQAAQQEMMEKLRKQQQEAQLKKLRQQLLQRLDFNVDAAGFLQTWAAETKPAESEKKTQAEEEGKENGKTAGNKSEPAVKEVSPTEKFQQEVEALKKAVALGKWGEVRTILAVWPKQDASMAYQRLLMSLAGQRNRSSSSMPPGFGGNSRQPPVSHLTADDLIGALFSSPVALESGSVSMFGRAVQQVTASGVPAEVLAKRFEQVIADPPANKPKWLDAPLMVDVLFASGLNRFATVLLPTVEEALKKPDFRALNQWSQILEDRFNQDSKRSDLVRAWELTQLVLVEGKRGDKETVSAIRRAVQLAHKLDDELGRQWLADSFTENPDRGRDVIAAIGLDYARLGLRSGVSPDDRRQSLALQKMAVEALIASSPETAKKWRKTLDVLALNWIIEANGAYRHTARGRRFLQYDSFGNPYYVDESRMMGSRSLRQRLPIVIDDLLELEPSDQWRTLLSSGLIPNLTATRARLHMKVGDLEPAYQDIQYLVKDYPGLAKELVNDFIDRWRENHKLNAGQMPRNPFMVVYGFNQRASGIPLTRSKQERNMRDLAEWLVRLRKLGVGDLDEDRLVAAFTDAHSVAEVYKLETIEQVFGPIDRLSVDLIARLLDRMRGNLSGIWRDPRYQQAMKTKRRKKDIEREVERGYRVALEVAEQALAQHPDSWQLPSARAALLIDRLNYRKEIEKSDSSFAELHSDAMEGFAQSAARYVAVVAELPKEERTVEPFQKWFYAALGSADIRGIQPDKVVDRSQIGKIAAALKSIPAPADRWHAAQFASSLYTRMSAVNPGSKFLYLEAGFEIVGDHKMAREARRLYDYYNDLVTEIRFETVLDVEDVHVGDQEPFGIFVQFRHTKEIERETGGFAKYTTNQNQVYYAYNYGRPLADYRDKFEEAAHQALQEDFEVLSIVYNSKDAHSKSTEEPGWRVTPYAYILLKPRGPHVDRVPPLKIDLDFTDTSGYVVLPIESSPLSIDASTTPPQPVLPPELTIVQTLDERQAADGELILEIKASAQGRIPALDTLLDLDPPGFEMESIDDQGVAVSQFAEDIDGTAVTCERLWLVHFRGAMQEGELVTKSFVFGKPKVDVKESLYQRYVDEDLVAVEATVPLEAEYAQATIPWWGFAGLAAGGVVLLLLVVWMWRLAIRRPVAEASRVPLPDEVTPFTVVSWLRHLDREGLVRGEARSELAGTIAKLEQAFFAESDGKEIDLPATLDRWAKMAAVS